MDYYSMFYDNLKITNITNPDQFVVSPSMKKIPLLGAETL